MKPIQVRNIDNNFMQLLENVDKTLSLYEHHTKKYVKIIGCARANLYTQKETERERTRNTLVAV